jgi:hypothetical protein
MAYTKKYKIQMLCIAFAVIVLLLTFFALGFGRYAYQRGLEDGLMYSQELKGNSKYIPNK